MTRILICFKTLEQVHVCLKLLWFCHIIWLRVSKEYERNIINQVDKVENKKHYSTHT